MKQRHVEFAVDLQTGAILSADVLQQLEERDHVELRRSVVLSHAARRRAVKTGAKVPEPRLKCAMCDGPIGLSRWNDPRLGNNRWFSHLKGSPDCPLKSEWDPRDLMALQYQGQQEGHAHRELKAFIATWLAREPGAADINVERVLFSLKDRTTWRRPDVRCVLDERPLVFEIQLSYTFLSVVVERDLFYASEKTHVIWVFRAFDLSRSTTQDELHFNRGNLFILDNEAQAETLRRNRLTFKVYFRDHEYFRETADLTPKWTWRFAHLPELTYPTANALPFRPYLVDSNAAIMNARAQIDFKRREAARARVIDAALAAFTSKYDRGRDVLLRDRLAALAEFDAGGGDHWEFRCHPGVLSRLLSIKMGRAIGYDPSIGMQGVINAIMNASVTAASHWTLYLTALKVFQPVLSREQQHRVQQWRSLVVQSIKENGSASPYWRDTRFDAVTSFLFPELREALQSPFGRIQQGH